MSVLNNNLTSERYAEEAANSLVRIAKNTFGKILNSYSNGVQTFWNNPRATPQEIADALGTDASEIFSLHYQLGQLIASVDPTLLEETSNLIGNFTQNEDGTVTITE